RSGSRRCARTRGGVQRPFQKQQGREFLRHTPLGAAGPRHVRDFRPEYSSWPGPPEFRYEPVQTGSDQRTEPFRTALGVVQQSQPAELPESQQFVLERRVRTAYERTRPEDHAGSREVLFLSQRDDAKGMATSGLFYFPESSGRSGPSL